MRAVLTVFLCVLISLISASGVADDRANQDLRQLFDKGDYKAVIKAGKDMKTAQGLSFASEAMSAQVLLGQVNKRRKTATRARKLAQKALKIDADSKEAIVQYALARGFETQSSSPMRVWRKGLIKKSKEAIIEVQETFPEDARGDALMGAWHLGIVRRAGEDRALDWFEATESEGIAFYEKSLLKRPDDIIILANFATALLAIDSERNLSKAKLLAQRAYAAKPGNALEMAVQTRLTKLQPLFGDSAALKAMAETILDDENDDEDAD